MNYTKDDLEKAFREGMIIGFSYPNGARNDIFIDRWNAYWHKIKPLEPGFYWVELGGSLDIGELVLNHNAGVIEPSLCWRVIGNDHRYSIDVSDLKVLSEIPKYKAP